MSIVDRIKWDMLSDDILVWKFPSDQIKAGSQLIVAEGQEAVFFRGGSLYDAFGPGTHTIVSSNLPLLHRVVNIPFGGQTPFSAEIWFINKLQKLDLKWGTKTPISLFDQSLGMPVSIRGYGRWGYQVENYNRLLKKVVGNQPLIRHDRLTEYLSGQVLRCLTEEISSIFKTGEQSIFQVSDNLDIVGKNIKTRIKIALEDLGLEILTFEVNSINIPENELENIRSVYQKTFEARELSKTDVTAAYGQIKAFEAMNNQSPSDASSIAGAVIGAGVGLSVGAPIAQELNKQVNISTQENKSENSYSDDDIVGRLKSLKDLAAQGLITDEEYKSAKEKILGSI